MTKLNYEKYDCYKNLHDSLSKALKNGFYYEAIFIEYAIFEDRLFSAIKYSGYVVNDQETERKRSLSIERKINIIRSHKFFSDKFVKERLTEDLLKKLIDWKDQRNKLVHALADIRYDAEAVKEIALSGAELLKCFKPKCQSVINRFKKINADGCLTSSVVSK